MWGVAHEHRRWLPGLLPCPAVARPQISLPSTTFFHAVAQLASDVVDDKSLHSRPFLGTVRSQLCVPEVLKSQVARDAELEASTCSFRCDAYSDDKLAMQKMERSKKFTLVGFSFQVFIVCINQSINRVDVNRFDILCNGEWLW